MLGYEKNSNAYGLWDPKEQRVLTSNDVTFDESRFPLSEKPSLDSEELAILNDTSYDEIWECNSRSPSSSPNPPSAPASDAGLENHSPPPPPSRPKRTTQPISRLGEFIGYHTTADFQQAVIDSVDDGPEHDEPSYTQAMKSPNWTHWIDAMSREFTSLQLHAVGTLVEAPEDANVLPGMWRLKRKRDKFQRITVYKARWVAGGNHQIKGVDFDSTWVSVGMTDTLRTLYSMAAVEDLEMQSFDIETAFLNGTPKHRIYIRQVTGFRDPSNPKHVMLLNKSLYGTCQAHREFNDDFNKRMKILGFNVCPVNNSLYTLRSGSSFIHIPMHVYDGMAFSNDKQMLDRFREGLKDHYKF